MKQQKISVIFNTANIFLIAMLGLKLAENIDLVSSHALSRLVILYTEFDWI